MKRSWVPSAFRWKGEAENRSKGVISGLGSPLFMHWSGLVVVAGLMLFAAIGQHLALLSFCTALLVLALLSYGWSRHALRGITFQMTLSQTRAFPGEKIELSFELTNEKILPLSWFLIEEELPCRLTKGKSEGASPFSKDRLKWATSVSGRQQLRWKHRVACQERGEYQVGPTRLRSGDLFGFFPREMLLPSPETVLVYPRIVPVEKLNLPVMGLFGERETTRSIHEDASRTIGTREYSHADPFKRIHWKASARQAELRSRQYECTTNPSIMFVLDVETFCGNRSEVRESFEFAVSVIASLALRACQEKFAVGFMANAVPEIQIPVSSGHDQLLLLLETLARIKAETRLPLRVQLDQQRRFLGMGTRVVLLSRFVSAATADMLRGLKRQGVSLFLLSLGNEMSGHPPQGGQVIRPWQGQGDPVA